MKPPVVATFDGIILAQFHEDPDALLLDLPKQRGIIRMLRGLAIFGGQLLFEFAEVRVDDAIAVIAPSLVVL